MRFSENTENSISEKSIFGHFEVTFLNVLNFRRAGVVFSSEYLRRAVFQRKDELSSWSQKKVIQFSAKVPSLTIFDYLGPHSKSIFSTYSQNFEKFWARMLGTLC